MEKASLKTQVFNVGVKWPPSGQFESGKKYIPLSGLYPVNGAEEPAIGEYLDSPPSDGTYVLGSINGVIQWIATEDCEDNQQ
jgi:hypothetical protein